MSAEIGLKTTSYFMFRPDISKNVYDKSWHDLFVTMREKSRFKRSKKKIHEYVTELITDGKLDNQVLKEFLFKQLSYGIHKDVFIYRFDNEDKWSEDDMKRKLKNDFNINDLEYNELDRIVDTDKCLGAVKVDIDEKTMVIQKLKLIFIGKAEYTTKEYKRDYGVMKNIEETRHENSYIPIEIDFVEKRLIVKSAPKSHINKSDFKGINLAYKFAGEIIESFNLNVISLQEKYQKALHNICRQLLESVIKEKCKDEINEFDPLINEVVAKFNEKFKELGIDTEKLKKSIKSKNVFDVYSNMLNMIENVVISKILVDAMKNKEGLQGIVSYIKFKDRTSAKAVIKTFHRKQTLLDSQSYLDLRKTLKESEFVERVLIVWFNEKEELQVAYDCKNMMYIHLHFYEKLFEKEFQYAVSRINEFENKGMV